VRLVYTALLYLLAPLVLARLWWRGRANPAYRQRWKERFGVIAPMASGPVIWVHAVSVGEAQAAQPLVKRLLEEYPDHRILVTTTTPTGADQVRRLFGSDVLHLYFPYDLPPVVRRYLAAVRPRLLLIMETEIWPNLLAACEKRGIPVLLLNARLSERSAGRYRRMGGLARQSLRRLSHIAVQTSAEAGRFAELGAPRDRLLQTGSLKFDIRLPASVVEQAEVLRLSWGLDRAMWVAASTHEGEDQQVLAAHSRLLERLPDALLVLVPRHPERFDTVADLVAAGGFRYLRRSTDGAGDPSIQVYLADTMGELPVFLAAADVAFVGGSLVGVGGHNVLEPAALGVPVVFGPHMFNFAAIADLFLAAGAARQVTDSDELAAVLLAWLGDAGIRAAVGDAGRQLVEANRGALERTLELVRRVLAGEGR